MANHGWDSAGSIEIDVTEKAAQEKMNGVETEGYVFRQSGLPPSTFFTLAFFVTKA
jgi:hypothetical protein